MMLSFDDDDDDDDAAVDCVACDDNIMDVRSTGDTADRIALQIFNKPLSRGGAAASNRWYTEISADDDDDDDEDDKLEEREESAPLETEALEWRVIPVGVIGGRWDDDKEEDDALDDDVAVDDDDALSFSVTELMTALVLNRDELFPLMITASG